MSTDLQTNVQLVSQNWTGKMWKGYQKSYISVSDRIWQKLINAMQFDSSNDIKQQPFIQIHIWWENTQLFQYLKPI